MRILFQVVFVVALFVLPTAVSASPFQRIVNSVPANQVQSWQLVPPQSQATQESPNFTNLRRSKPQSYLLDSGDVLGIFLEGVLGKSDESAPIHYPPPGSDLGPSMGYPTLVLSDGTVSLPMVDRILVRGLTVQQAEAKIRSVYSGQNKTGQRILTDNSRVIVSLQRKRTIKVTVIRGDNSAAMAPLNSFRQDAVNNRSDRSARSSTIHLDAYDNDVLNALIATGGLPGLNAKPNATIYRARPAGSYSSGQSAFPRSNNYNPNASFPRSSATAQVPLRHSTMRPTYPGQHAQTRQNSVLRDGDLLVVDSKPTEVYYTGGLLRGGEHLLPRDKSLSVIDAIALAGGPVASTINRFGISRLPPTELNIVRNNPQQGQVNIRVDLNRAYNDPSQRILVAPGDHLILRYKPAEQIGNFGIETFNTFGLRRVFQ